MMRRYSILLTLLIFCTLGLWAQKVTVKAIDKPAAEVFRSIMEQTDKNFVYSSDLLKDMKITVSVNKKPLKKVLDEIFHDSGIKYEIKGNNVILKKKKSKGLQKKTITPKTHTETKINISDSVRVTMLQPVEVVSQSENHPLETAKLGVSTLGAADVRNTPALFGEPDLIKTIQILPGVSESTAGIAGMNVHGGNADENLYILDNVPLYQVEHIAGLFSPFNTDIVRQTDFYRTSVPARYDGRLSSFLDVHLKNGNRNGHHGSARLGLTAGAFNISGPLGSNTTYLLGLRRSWFDVFTAPIFAIVNSRRTDEKSTFQYHFMDFNARIEHRFSDTTGAFISAYYGDDLLKVVTKDYYDNNYYCKDIRSFNWGNFLIQAGMHHKIRQNLNGEFSIAFTRYFSHMGFDIFEKRSSARDTISEREIMKSANYINTLRARADFNWRPLEDSDIRFGASYSHQYFMPDHMNKEFTNNDTTLYTKM
ncbi:MAG: secretin and TonB N-terminal domain-containing protein, partial [Muribaculaceae bacterium]|nr:secretin and TonB N-terminal domain-containing protein [Muribaculaceae bacterium]